MARRSLTERYEELEGRREGIAARQHERIAPSPVHLALVDVLGDLLTLGNTYANDRVPLPLRTMMRMLDGMRGTLLEELATVPPEQIIPFMAGLRDQIDRIVQAGAGATGAPALPAAVDELEGAPAEEGAA